MLFSTLFKRKTSKEKERSRNLKGRFSKLNSFKYKLYKQRFVNHISKCSCRHCMPHKAVSYTHLDMFASYLEHFSKFGKKDTCLDRVDLNKSFNKENCFWTTIKQHSSNRNKKKLNNTQFINLIIEYVDRYKETPSQRLIARHFNVTHMTVYNKIKQLEAEGLISRRLVNKNKVCLLYTSRCV